MIYKYTYILLNMFIFVKSTAVNFRKMAFKSLSFFKLPQIGNKVKNTFNLKYFFP